MSDTTRLKLPLLAAAQAQKHTTHNDALTVLDALVQLAVKSRTLSAPPATPAEGDCYIVAASATGGWTSKAGQIAAFQDGVWRFYAARAGWLVYLEDEDCQVVWTGTAWASPAVVAKRLGINAAPDAANRIVASLAAALFTDEGAGLQIKLNKTGLGDTASYLFQTGYSGRAEFGLVGGDDFALKVSPDGNTWNTGFTVDRTTGNVTLTNGALRSQVDVMTASGTWTKPAWARRVTVMAVGAAGGGGSGRRGAATADRFGGGGGGAGGIIVSEFLASELGATLTCTVGAGGAGGAAAAADDTSGTAGGAGGASTVFNGSNEISFANGGNGGAGGSLTAGAGGSGFLGSPSGGAGQKAAGTDGPYGSNSLAPGAGAGGGGLAASASVASAGGIGSFGAASQGASRRGLQGTAGAAGANGGTGGSKGWSRGVGGGGGAGGSGNIGGTAAGGSGGAGGVPGGGGGGGGASTNGANSGAGGAGGRGEIWFLSWG